ncbi:hypothetical protein SAMN04515673_106215 [Poseidonocella sedimentorum]|uniref:Uncharacterized protein n=1 Tax=Poseidonocella sedimentorum TaxID=871652 RepID=A0A1I6E1S0_9RHOB|nr:hypothetical protein SAMN04515673_106215 [Poseidonocella sedimentorum]
MDHPDLSIVPNFIDAPNNLCSQPLLINFLWLTFDFVVGIYTCHFDPVGPLERRCLESPVPVIGWKSRGYFVAYLSQATVH